ncbi:MAG: hypothetical protein ACREK9_14810 [Candidatus Rokuibacteriota bacterium]
MSTYTRNLQRIVNDYMASGRSVATAREIAAWAVHSNLWQPRPADVINQCAEQLSRAMREEYIVDPQGRSVRAKHAARVEQLVFWADIRTAEPTHMEIAFKQRRQQILGDCRQFQNDVDSFNENRKLPKTIQIIFDFTRDLEEEALAS